MKECFRCGKEFRDNYSLSRHLDKKELCTPIYLIIQPFLIRNKYEEYYDLYLSVRDKKMLSSNGSKREKIVKKSSICSQKNDEMYPKVSQKCCTVQTVTNNNNIENLQDEKRKWKCEKCLTEFTFRSNYHRHKKHYCMWTKQNQNFEAKFLLLELEHEKKMKKYEELLEKQKEDFEDQVQQIQDQINNNNSSSNNNQEVKIPDIIINNYGEEDLSSITKDQWLNIFQSRVNMIFNAIKAIYIDIPENRNMYFANPKNGYMSVFKNQDWVIKCKKDVLYDVTNKIGNILVEKSKEYTLAGQKNIRGRINYILGPEGENGIVVRKNVKNLLIEHRESINSTYYEKYGKNIRKS